jgi:hypothetical protein
LANIGKEEDSGMLRLRALSPEPGGMNNEFSCLKQQELLINKQSLIGFRRCIRGKSFVNIQNKIAIAVLPMACGLKLAPHSYSS